jgi:hypothetical protein
MLDYGASLISNQLESAILAVGTVIVFLFLLFGEIKFRFESSCF